MSGRDVRLCSTANELGSYHVEMFSYGHDFLLFVYVWDWDGLRAACGYLECNVLCLLYFSGVFTA